MGFFERLSVRGKVMGGFAVVIIFTILISTVSVLIMLNFNSASSYAHEVLAVRRVTLSTVRDMIDNMHNDLFESQAELENNTPGLLKDIEEKVVAVSAKVKALRGRTTPQQTAIIKNSIAEYENLYRNEFLPALAAQDLDRMQSTFAKMHKLKVAADKACANIVETQIGNGIAKIEENTSYTPIYGILVASSCATVLAIMIAMIVSNYTVKNLRTALIASSAIAKGDLSKPVKSTSKDEFGKLLDEVEQMRTQLNELVGKIKSSVVQAVSDFGSIHDITMVIDESARSNESKAMTVAAASDEMVSTTGDIAKNCQNAALTADESNKSTQDGVDKVHQTIDSIREQVEKSKKDASLVARLVDQTQKIGTIVQTIEDIASQTNLLALNAAIEPVRALLWLPMRFVLLHLEPQVRPQRLPRWLLKFRMMLIQLMTVWQLLLNRWEFWQIRLLKSNHYFQALLKMLHPLILRYLRSLLQLSSRQLRLLRFQPICRVLQMNLRI